MAVKILAFAGSARVASFNKKLVRLAAEGARTAGAEVTLIDLKDYPMPLMDQDLEEREGLPENARKLRELFFSHQGLLIASPENNSSMSALLKNVIDWVSRQQKGEAPLAPFEGKVAALMSASPGGLGGLRGLVHVRAMLENIRVLVIPDQMALPAATDAFLTDGRLKDARRQAAAEKIGATLVSYLQRLHSI